MDPGIARELYVQHERESRSNFPTAYDPPPEGMAWQMALAVTMAPLSASEKAILGALIDHANPATGRCDPSQGRLARMLLLPRRTVERAISKLIAAGFIGRLRRGRKGASAGGASSNAYGIAWDKLAGIFEAYKTRGPASRGQDATNQLPATPVGRYPTKLADYPPTKMSAKKKKKNEKREKEAVTAPPDGGADILHFREVTEIAEASQQPALDADPLKALQWTGKDAENEAERQTHDELERVEGNRRWAQLR